LTKFNTIDSKEVYAASTTIMEASDDHSPLSGYIGSKADGGPMCRKLEDMWCETFGVHHAVAVNSATSGLLAACMAIEIQAGDEVIVSPYTMSASAAAPKLLGAKIVFADIEEETFGLDPVEVANAITPKTVAVIVTNLFGHPARLHELRAICDENHIYLIEDNAQAIFAKENGKYTGTIGHAGVFSLNVHKQIQVGEGGVVVTNHPDLSIKLREAMNHGEMRGGILGLNMRMTEVTAAMAIEQLRKAPQVIDDIRSYAKILTHYIKTFGAPVEPPTVRQDCEHSYYCWAGLIAKDMNIEVPPPFTRGYMRPLYELRALKQNIRLDGVEKVQESLILLELCSLHKTAPDVEELVGRLRRKR